MSIRIPPVPLEGPLTITLEGDALTALNHYRERYHAWTMHPGFGEKGESLKLELANAASDLAKAVSRLAQ